MNPTPEVPQVRAIVPGRLDKAKTATPRAVTVERFNQEGPLTLAHTAIKKAEKTYKGFHAVYSALYVMIAMPEDPPDPIFEEMWATLTLTPEQKEITVHLHLDENENIKSADLSNLPPGWTYDYVSIDPDDEIDAADIDEADIDPNGFDQGSPYNHTNHL